MMKTQIINLMVDDPVYEDIDPIFFHFTQRENLAKILSDGFLGDQSGFMPVFCINLTIAQKYKNINSLMPLLKNGKDYVCLMFNADPNLFKFYPEDCVSKYNKENSPLTVPITDCIVISAEEAFELIGIDSP